MFFALHDKLLYQVTPICKLLYEFAHMRQVCVPPALLALFYEIKLVLQSWHAETEKHVVAEFSAHSYICL